MDKFIYVFTEDDANKLLDMHYTLLCADEISQKYVFLNKEQLDFSVFGNIRFVMSNVLTFHN